ncbi:MAG: MBL fold metallo-hydrolase [Clostridiales bacterium]|nr:MBL fold metallo-hydrolase [Clostridiales bacterium]
MKITFLGAVHEVTGSCTLIEVGGRHILVDCGMEQGKDTFVNCEIPVSPDKIDYVLLTHAHIDHSGKIPKLYKDGYTGSVYATEETCNLCRIMLMDSAHIQEVDSEWRNRKAKRSGEVQSEPVYTKQDALLAISHLRSCRYGEKIQISENVIIRFNDIGHLLGSAAIEIWLNEGGVEKKIVFSGDIGNINQPFINDPKPVSETDYLVMESTYGNRLHEASTPGCNTLADYLQRTLDRGGNVVIPSFAVGRTQEMLFFIREIKEKGLVKEHDGFPVYVDSPLANAATGIFLQADRECLDSETLALVDAGINPLMFPGLRVSETSEESKQINSNTEPKVIISASGMCEAGRIRHHLKHNLWDEKNLILFVGYQAEGTLGRALLNGVKRVKLFGEEIIVRAEIGFLPGKSGHADRAGLMAWLSHFEKKPEMVFVNHGQVEVCEEFTAYLIQEGYRAYAPFSCTVFDLARGEFVETPAGIPVKETFTKSAAGRAAYNKLLRAVSRLEEIARKSEGMSNKDLARFSDQIEALISKMEN